MDILNGLKKDIEKGLKQGVDAVKSTATLVREKAEELTEKGKTQYQLYELNNKLQKQFADLGGKLHQLAKSKKVKISNQELRKLITAIDKIQSSISKLESKEASAAVPKKPAAKKAPIKKQKPAARKTVKQKAKVKPATDNKPVS